MKWLTRILSNTADSEVRIHEFSEESIVFNLDGQYIFMPQSDITAYEVALLLPLFAVISYPFNRQEYLTKHDLLKHFVRKNGSSD